ncbi:MAG: hypothetical protein ACJAZ0_000391 [Halioglobus sp.]|jgi:hypothetical protein
MLRVQYSILGHCRDGRTNALRQYLPTIDSLCLGVHIACLKDIFVMTFRGEYIYELIEHNRIFYR